MIQKALNEGDTFPPVFEKIKGILTAGKFGINLCNDKEIIVELIR